MDSLKCFDRKWGRRMRQKRRKCLLSVHSVSKILKMPTPVIRMTEQTPSRVPLCDFYHLLKFYGASQGELIELLTLPSGAVVAP